MIRRLLGLLFPPKCVLCGKLLTKEQTDLCPTCRLEAPVWQKRGQKLRFIADHTAVWYYEGHVRSSILRYKFRRTSCYCHCYGRMLAMRVLQELPEDIGLVTWVPISTRRLRKRGYDQSRLLAQAVAQELQLPLEHCLVKKKHNQTQSEIRTPEARRANVLGAYEVCSQIPLAGKKILLVDDVITTGATAGECARMLLMSGAKEVYCAAVAAGRNHKH